MEFDFFAIHREVADERASRFAGGERYGLPLGLNSPRKPSRPGPADFDHDIMTPVNARVRITGGERCTSDPPDQPCKQESAHDRASLRRAT